MSDLVAELFAQNAWANLRLIEACRALTDEQLDATTVGSFGSVRETLIHLCSAEQSYAERLGATLEVARVREDFPSPPLDVLEASVRATSRALAEGARTRAGAQLPARFGDGPGVMDAEVVLVQAINHSTEHRSQICTILTALGLTPPEIDGWTWGEAEGRMRLHPTQT
jgi:uncharacterized damage-inducible protein DinB